MYFSSSPKRHVSPVFGRFDTVAAKFNNSTKQIVILINWVQKQKEKQQHPKSAVQLCPIITTGL